MYQHVNYPIFYIAETRKELSLEERWSNMKEGVDIDESLTHDQFLGSIAIIYILRRNF